MQKDSCSESSVDSPIYNSYSSKKEDSIAGFQEGWPVDKWVTKYQQHFFLEKPKVEEMNNIYSFPNQDDVGLHNFQEYEVVSSLSRQLYDPIADYMTTLFC